jgi:hypothetical protein
VLSTDVNIPKVLSVAPNEYAQNISDVSSRQDFIDLALALSAAYKNVSVSSDTDYVKNSQRLLNAIQRQPLELGFECAPDTFGVLIGGPFKITNDGKSDGFEQTPVRYAFTADIAVPGWWSQISIKARYFWIDDKGEVPQAPFEDIHGSAAWSGATPPGEDTTSVTLPSDPDAITAAVGYLNDRQARVPQIEINTSGVEGLNYTLQATTQPAGLIPPPSTTQPTAAEQTLLIRGSDLWRNPRVYVGSHLADSVDVLPDMHGLLAHFKTFPYPATQPTAAGDQENLTVITTFGADAIYKYVTVLPPNGTVAAPKTNATFATLNNNYIVDCNPPAIPPAVPPPPVPVYQQVQGPGDLTFNLDKTSTPALGAADLRLYAKMHNSPYTQWMRIDSPTTPVLYPPNQVVYKLTATDFHAVSAALPPGGPWALDLDLRAPGANPTMPEQSILTGSPQAVAFFFKASDRYLDLLANVTTTVAKNGTITGGIQIKVPDPNDPRMLAYPGLAAALQGSAPVKVLLTDTRGTSIETTGAPHGSTLDVGSVGTDNSTIANLNYSVAVEVPTGGGKTIDVPVDPLKYTVHLSQAP